MKKYVFIGVFLALLGGLDAVAKGWAESKIESRARAEAGVNASASADIDSFPFVGKLLAFGNAGDLELRLRDVQSQSLKFSRVTITLEDLNLDRGKLFSGKAEVTSIDTGTITMGFTAADLSAAVKMPVEIADGRISVTVRGVKVAAVPEATAEGSVRLQVSGLPAVNVPIPRTRLVSCSVDKVSVKDDELRASCTIEEIPPALLRAAQDALAG